MTYKCRVSLQCSAPGSGCSSNRYRWSRAHRAHAPPLPVTFAASAVCLRPSGDLTGVSEFPFLTSHTFHGGCCARWNGCFKASRFFSACLNLGSSFLSALLGFLLLLATVRLKSGFSLQHFGVWIFLAKVIGLHLFRCDSFLKSDSEAAAAVIRMKVDSVSADCAAVSPR